jgi:Homeodomain-like domain
MIKEQRILMSYKELDRLQVMKKLSAGGINQEEASIELGLSTRQIRRIFHKYTVEGAEGVTARYKSGNRGFDESFKEKVIFTLKLNYHDFGPTFAAEKLREQNNLIVNRETLRQWMIEEKLWTGKKRRKARIHQSRERRSRYGELIQIDGSHHAWFEGRGSKCCLLVFIDDATGKLMELRFEESETTRGYFECVNNYIRNYGLPLAFYSDKDSVFTVNAPGKIDGLKGETQFARAMREVKIEIILAHSPQAKGRVERANGTLQDRLVKEMRLRNICNIKEGNEYLPEFIKEYNKKFSIVAASKDDAHRKIGEDELLRLEEILSIRDSRRLSKNLEFSYKNVIYQVKRKGTGYSFRHSKVDIFELADGRILVKKGSEYLNYETINKGVNALKLADSKEINSIMDKLVKKEAA